MKKILLSGFLLISILISALRLNAQLPAGSVAPNFTLTDLEGDSHTLYSYLDAGKVVFIDFSATWCAPCWSYHGTHALRDLYNAHGPSGDNTVMVFFIEGDCSTTLADLQGTGTNTQGDWVTGVPYPIFSPTDTQCTNINDAYAIGYFPTVYRICPNRIISEPGQLTAAQLWTSAQGCPAPASVANDPAIINYTGTTVTCGGVNMKVQLQNNGTSPLTACTIQAKQGTTVLNTVNWTGNLATYALDEIDLGPYTISATTTLTFLISSTDQNAANNTITKSITYSSTTGSSSAVTVKITTDRYGTETSWKIKNISTGAVVGSGGPFTDHTANGAFPQPDVNINLANDCFMFEILDAYGDGMCCDYGNGSYMVKSGTATITSGGTFTSSQSKAFRINSTVGMEEVALMKNIEVFPVPAKGTLYIKNADNSIVTVYNIIGEAVTVFNCKSEIETMDITSYKNGTYIVKVQNANEVTVKRIVIEN